MREQMALTCIRRASTSSSVLSALDAKLNTIAAQTAVHKKHQQEYEKQLQANLKDVHDKQKEKSLGGTGGERGGLGRRGTLQFDRERENLMEVDDLDPRGKGRKFTYVFTTLFACG
jgi:COP9 signalosome complex subunit 7